MTVALYHPEYGYYRRRQDPFGKHGDFYTATQLQPVFGMLVRAIADGLSSERVVVDIGAGRQEMRSAFDDWTYIPVDVDDAMPEHAAGILFANELFDALPCRARSATGEALVDFRNGRFLWTDPPVSEDCPQAAAMLRRMARALDRGYLIVADYGYEAREQTRRFPQGSLTSYRRHIAYADVLDSPGERDITFHVNFTSLVADAAAAGFELLKKQTLASWLMSAGEDVIARAAQKDALQLKTLLFGMGESFDVLLFRRIAGSLRSHQNAT